MRKRKRRKRRRRRRKRRRRRIRNKRRSIRGVARGERQILKLELDASYLQRNEREKGERWDMRGEKGLRN